MVDFYVSDKRSLCFMFVRLTMRVLFFCLIVKLLMRVLFFVFDCYVSDSRFFVCVFDC